MRGMGPVSSTSFQEHALFIKLLFKTAFIISVQENTVKCFNRGLQITTLLEKNICVASSVNMHLLWITTSSISRNEFQASQCHHGTEKCRQATENSISSCRSTLTWTPLGIFLHATSTCMDIRVYSRLQTHSIEHLLFATCNSNDVQVITSWKPNTLTN